MRKMSSEESRWYLGARHKYVWDRDTFAEYFEVIAEVVRHFIGSYGFNSPPDNSLVSPNIGLISLADGTKPEKPFIGYALYVAHVRLGRRTLFGEFKEMYRFFVGADEMSYWLADEKAVRRTFPPDRAEVIVERARKRAKLVRNFKSLANKSLNHRRSISPRVRYEVLQRDKSTCQICGHRAPEVKLHIDHIRPVSWERGWEPSDNPDDYQVLCEDCNLGKGNLSWLLSA